MTSATAVVLEQHTQTAFTTFLSNPHASIPSTTRSVTPHEPALVLPISNVRERSPSPTSSYEQEMHIPFYLQSQRVLPLDPIYALPPPDSGVRFVYKGKRPVFEEGTSLLGLDAPEDTPNGLSTPLSDPSILPPRIYFVDNPIEFVPPFCHDYLERDPLVKGVPRNYRAWARTGRPKLQIEGLERVDAKRDFLAMGLIYPPGSDDEDSGDEKEKGKKGRRKKKSGNKAPFIPIERPRRMVRKIVEAEPPTVISTQKKGRVPEKKVEGKAPPLLSLKPISTKIESIVDVIDDKDEDALGETDSEAELDSANSSLTAFPAPSSSEVSQTLPPPAPNAQAKSSKRKRPQSGKVLLPVPSAKKARISQRLTLRRRRSSIQPAQNSVIHPAPVQQAPVGTSAIKGPATSSEAAEEKYTAQIVEFVRRPRSRSRSAPIPIPPVPRPRPPPRPRQTQPSISTSAITFLATNTGGLPPSRPGHRISLPVSVARQVVHFRSFPPSVPIIPGYAGFYRRFPLITQFEKDDHLGLYVLNGGSPPKRPLGNWNAPRDVRDLYTPRYTKGSGGKKIALCPICYEETSRGGEGRQEWNHTKTSQHNYHMQYYHGISATRFQPFSPPIVQRTIPILRPQSNEKPEILQGQCHNCKLWIALEGCKVGELKVKELFWWKHAAACHKDSFVQGEKDIFIEDDAYNRLLEYESLQRNG